MLPEKADIIHRLQKDILHLQGFKHLPTDIAMELDLGPIEAAFPNHSFPLSAIHEFVCAGAEHAAATDGFISCLVAALMNKGGVSVWISPGKTIFPPALKSFGITPDRIIFIHTQKEKETLWVMEEALKCEGLAAVVGEMKEISFIDSRRLQLAVEQSRVTGFIVRDHPRNLQVNACISRWKISPVQSASADDLPGIGFPCWNIELLKIRNGKPGSWQVEWSGGKFHFYSSVITSLLQEQKRKTG